MSPRLILGLASGGMLLAGILGYFWRRSIPEVIHTHVSDETLAHIRYLEGIKGDDQSNPQ